MVYIYMCMLTPLSFSFFSSPGHEGLSNPLGLVGPADVRGALDGA